MSVFDRLRRGTDADVTHKVLRDLTDEQLEAELLRRRRQRAGIRSNLGPVASQADKDNPEQKRLLQYYANLELPAYASLDEVKRSYRELMKRYHPDKHAGDRERQKAAEELSQSLTRAYEALSSFLSGR